MYLNNFSVQVVGGDEQPGGYVELNHKQTYKLRLKNDGMVRCDAAVYIDGKHSGTFRIGGRSNIMLERPANDSGKFTFFLVDSSEGKSSELSHSNPDLGLIKVVFTPEKEYVKTPVFIYNDREEIKRWPTQWDGSLMKTSAADESFNGNFRDESFTSIDPSETVNARGGAMRRITASSSYTAPHSNFFAAAATPQRQAGGTGLSGESSQKFENVASLDYDYSLETTIHLRLIEKVKTPEVRPLRPMTHSSPVPPRIS